MAGGNQQLILEIAAILNSESVLAQSKKMYADISKLPPIDFKVAFGGAEGASSAQQAFEDIKSKASKIGDVTAQITKIRDASGQVKDVITSTTTTWVDSMGVMQKTITPVTQGINEVKTATEVLQKTTATMNLGAGVTAHLNEFDKYGKKIADVGKTAEAYASKGASWDSKKQDALKKLQIELDNVVKEYNKLNPAEANSVKQAEKLVAEAGRLDGEMKKINASVHTGSNVFQNWGNRLTNAIKNTIAYTFTLGGMRKAQQLLNEAIRFNIDLNAEMTKIQVLQAQGAQTPDEIASLARAFNSLGKQMGATTLEVARGSVEWLRQGKTIEETTELLKASTIMSKLGNLDAAQSTEYLTSVLNGYQMEASEAINVVSKLVAVDNVAATSTAELATALRYSSAVAAEAGVSFEKLVSYIGVISQTTRQNAEMIGQALKTIFTRMQDIMQGGLDEEGLGINNVERALRRVNMTIMESETEFRDLDAVLEELSAKWDTLTEVEQSNIAKAIAGTRQRNMFLILMQEMNEALRLQEVQAISTGLALERYDIYMESITAKQAVLKTSIESLFLEEGFQKGIKLALEFATSIVNLIDNLGGLKTVINYLIAVLLSYVIAKRKSIIVTKLFETAIGADLVKSIKLTILAIRNFGLQSAITAGHVKLLGRAMKAAFMSNIVGIILTVVATVVSLADAMETASEKAERFAEQIKESNDKIEALYGSYTKITELSETIDELEALAKVTKLNEEQTKQLTDAKKALTEALPNTIGYFDAEGNFIAYNTEKTEELTQAILNQIAAEELRNKKFSEAGAEAYGENLADLYYKLQTAQASYEEDSDNFKKFEAWQTALTNYNNALLQYIPIYLEYGEEAGELFTQGFFSKLNFLKGKGQTTVPAEELAKDFNEAFGNAFGQYAGVMIPKRVEEALKNKSAHYQQELGIEIPITISEENLIATVDNVKSDIENLYSIKDKYEKEGLLGLGEKERAILEEFGIDIKTFSGDLSAMEEDIQKYIDAIREINPAFADALQKALDTGDGLSEVKSAVEQTADAMSTLESDMQMLSSAWSQFNSTGQISTDMAYQMAQAGYGAALAINQETGAITIDEQALRNLIATRYEAIATSIEQQIKDNITTNTLLNQIPALKANADAWRERANAMRSGAAALTTVFSGYAGGGGGGSGTKENPQKKAREDEIKSLQELIKTRQEASKAEIKGIEKTIDALEKKKDAIDKEIDKLEERKDKFAKYIDLQKESLKREKETQDYLKGIEERNKEITNLDNELLALQFDNSEEASAKRLELEAEKAEKVVDLEEEQEERRYDLQVQALDDLQAKFEASIDAKIAALEKEKKKIDATIEKYRELIESINEWTEAFIEGINQQIEAIRDLIEALDDLDEKESSSGGGRETFSEKVARMYGGKTPTVQAASDADKGRGEAGHQGGIVPKDLEKHHYGDFAGNLRSNEVFAKLLKGEYVATENQMDNFMKNILPKVMTHPVTREINQREMAQKQGNITVSIPITVQGNLDKSVLPDIEKIADKVTDRINKTMLSRGYLRTANQTIS